MVAFLNSIKLSLKKVMLDFEKGTMDAKTDVIIKNILLLTFLSGKYSSIIE